MIALHKRFLKEEAIEIKGDYVYVQGHVMFITSADDEDNDGGVLYNESSKKFYGLDKYIQ